MPSDKRLGKVLVVGLIGDLLLGIKSCSFSMGWVYCRLAELFLTINERHPIMKVVLEAKNIQIKFGSVSLRGSHGSGGSP